MTKRSIHFLLFTLALLSPTALANAVEIAPGRITNPGGLQRFQGAAYNSQDDEYMLIYEGSNIPRVRQLGVDGTFLAPVVLLDSDIGVANVGIVYNPNANEYGRYLTNLGVPIGNRFVVGTGGAFGTAAYSITSDRYLVAWRKGPSPIQVKFAFIDGDSGSGNPIIERDQLANGDNAHTAWGSQTDQFMVVYSREAGTLKEETFAKLMERGRLRA